MSYSDLRDFCPEVIFPVGPLYERGTNPIQIEIEKSGGGTPGKEYTGTWRYQVRVDDVVTYYGQDLETGMPHTHLGAAIALVDFLTKDDEDASPNTFAGRLQEWRSQFTED